MAFLVGFDGGLTKTALALCDPGGHLLARARGRGTAIVGMPTDEFFATAKPLLEGLCRHAGTAPSALEQIVIGLSGVDFDDEIAAQHSAIAAGLGLDPARLTLVNDGVAALWGASTATPLTIVQHGSGVTMAFRAEHGRTEVFDSLDVGAVFDIRREAAARVARMIDGRAEQSDLMRQVLACAGVGADRFADWVMRHSGAKSRIAALAAIVFDAWRAGDSTATDLVHRAADDYVLATRAMGAHVAPDDRPFSAAFGGGVIAQGGAQLQQLLATKLAEACPRARSVSVELPPEAGALVLAAQATGRDADMVFAHIRDQWSPA